MFKEQLKKLLFNYFNQHKMETLKISKENALKAYNEGCPDVKKVMENLFGDELFPKNIKDRIKTFEDACKHLKLNDHGDAYRLLKLDRKLFSETSILECEDSYLKLMIIYKALNQEWKPDWNDSNQKKWYPWFEWKNKSGFGFSATDYGYSHTYSTVGSRLCLRSSDLAEYVGRQFENIFKQALNP